jgi:hypothetical protein
MPCMVSKKGLLGALYLENGKPRVPNVGQFMAGYRIII